MKDLSNLSDSKKREANSLNDDILEKLSEDFQNLNLGKSSSGQVYIQIGLVSNLFCLIFIYMVQQHAKALIADVSNLFLPLIFV